MKSTIYSSVNNFVRDMILRHYVYENFEGSLKLQFSSEYSTGFITAIIPIVANINTKTLQDQLLNSQLRDIATVLDGNNLKISKKIHSATEGRETLEEWMQSIHTHDVSVKIN